MGKSPEKSLSFYLLLLGGFLCVMVLVQVGMDRPAICPCGTVKLWQNAIHSPQISQHLTDWYTLSHVSHGIVFFAVLTWFLPEKSFLFRLLVATGLEVSWEIIENTEFVIEYYRQNTISRHFTGDSIVNSTVDVVAMLIGFELTRRIGITLGLALFVLLELVMISVIRDSLLLNVLMLLYPIEAIEAWQLGAVTESPGH